jgi:hypothetical protein
MSELVKDPVYRKFLETQPKTPRITRDKAMMQSPPWVVYIQREVDGSWGKKEFWKYSEAFKFMRAWLKRGAHDAAINNKRFGFDPPLRFARIRGKYIVGSDGVKRQATKAIPWQPKLGPGDPEHHWCRFCRRPTVFKYFGKHKRLGRVDPTTPRCSICGASARIALGHADRLFRVH